MGVIVAQPFGFDEIRKRVENRKATSDDKKIARWLSYIGEELCNHARTITKGHNSGGYNDQTGNLRSSIGYRIYKDGEKYRQGGFKNVGRGSGIQSAKTALDAYAVQNKIPLQGWTLVIVAGMSYAAYVEAKGFNVLHLTEVEMRKRIEELRIRLRL